MAARSAGGEGCNPAATRRAATKRSMGFCDQRCWISGGSLARADGSGTIGRRGGMKAQCSRYSAPEAIHARSVARSAGVRSFRAAGGGMTSSASVESMRLITSLADGSPGTIGCAPDLAVPIAAERTSSRMRALRACSSGPWHLKQWLARIGRTAVVKSGASAAGQVLPAASARSRRRRFMTGTLHWNGDVIVAPARTAQRWSDGRWEVRAVESVDAGGWWRGPSRHACHWHIPNSRSGVAGKLPAASRARHRSPNEGMDRQRRRPCCRS